MRRNHLLSIVFSALLLPTTGWAEEAVEVPSANPAGPAATASADGAAEMTWDQFDDPAFDPGSAPAPVAPAEEAVASQVDGDPVASPESTTAGSVSIASGEDATTQGPTGIVLGPEGIDDQGRRGRLHTVRTGDTLWDLAAAYLGTPWVWPSVWIDNDDIANPHLIRPNDKIWITANEMRVVTDAEAEAYVGSNMAGSDMPSDSDGMDAVDPTETASPSDQPLAAFDDEPEDPSVLEAFPVAVVGQESGTTEPMRQVTISRRDSMGFVSEEELAGASSIVDAPTERTYLAEGDRIVLGMGEGDVEVGDQFTIFRVIEEVRDIETNRILGHHVDVLGWVEVEELTGDTSLAEIRMSYSEIQRGARVMPRKRLPAHVAARTTPDAIEGKIVFLPAERTLMADGGYVYLNRGEFHGIEVGTELEVFEAGSIVNDRPRRVDVRTPDHSVARLVVVAVEAESSVAFVLDSKRELAVGDDVRPLLPKMARR